MPMPMMLHSNNHPPVPVPYQNSSHDNPHHKNQNNNPVYNGYERNRPELSPLTHQRLNYHNSEQSHHHHPGDGDGDDDGAVLMTADNDNHSLPVRRTLTPHGVNKQAPVFARLYERAQKRNRDFVQNIKAKAVAKSESAPHLHPKQWGQGRGKDKLVANGGQKKDQHKHRQREAKGKVSSYNSRFKSRPSQRKQNDQEIRDQRRLTEIGNMLQLRNRNTKMKGKGRGREKRERGKMKVGKEKGGAGKKKKRKGMMVKKGGNVSLYSLGEELVGEVDGKSVGQSSGFGDRISDGGSDGDLKAIPWDFSVRPQLDDMDILGRLNLQQADDTTTTTND